MSKWVLLLLPSGTGVDDRDNRTSRLPVVYVFGRKPIDVDECVQELSKILTTLPDTGETVTRSVLVRHDVGYSYRMGAFRDSLRREQRLMVDFIGDIGKLLRERTELSVLYHEIPTRVDPTPALDSSTPENEADQSTSSNGDFKIEEVPTILYIGEESLTLTNLLMTHSSSRVCLFGR